MKASLLTTLLVSTCFCQDWPQYLGPNGDGTVEGEIPAKIQQLGPKKRWEAQIGTGCSSFAISQGKAITVGNKDNQDTLWCFDTKTGEVIWKKTYAEDLAPKYYDGGPGATPTIDGGLVYNLSKSGRLSCHDFQTGEEKWVLSYKDDFGGNMPTWGYSASPLVYGELLICLPCDKGSAMVALDKKTGNVEWKSKNTARPGYAAPVFCKHQGKEMAIVFHGRSIVGYDLSSQGEVVFSYEWRTSYDVNASNPVYHDGKVFFASGYGMGYGVLDIQGNEPKLLHRDRDSPMIFQNAFLVGDDILGCFGDKRRKAELFQMDLETGKLLWKYEIPGSRASTVKVGETLAVLSEDGVLVFGKADEKGFTESSRHQVLSKLCWAPLAIGDGKAFLRTNRGSAICLDLLEE